MSRLDELPPDQRAALSLLLRQRKSYAEVSLLLGIAERAVHDRAHAALAVLAPRQARELDPEHREELGDYLLGQTGVAERLRTRTYLAGSEPARAWAQAISQELAPLGSELPEIPAAAGPPPSERPAGPPPPAPATSGEGSSASHGASAGGSASSPPPSAPAAPASSRLGGALLLAAILVAVVVGVILLTSGGGSHAKSAASTTASSSTTAKSGPTVSPQMALRSPIAASKSVGVVVVLSEKDKRAFYIEAQHLPATNGFFYAIWLYNSPTDAVALSRAPTVGSNHKLAGGASLPTNAASFHEMLLTRETNPHPTRPGHVVLHGAFSLAG